MNWISLSEDVVCRWAVMNTNGPFGSRKAGKFVNLLTDCWLYNEVSTSCSPLSKYCTSDENMTVIYVLEKIGQKAFMPCIGVKLSRCISTTP